MNDQNINDDYKKNISSQSKNKKLFILLGILVLIAVIALMIAFQEKKPKLNNSSVSINSKNYVASVSGTSTTTPRPQTPEAVKATNNLINDVAKSNSTVGSTSTISISVPLESSSTTASTTKLIKVIKVAPGTSPIDVNSGQVLTPTGQVVDNAAPASSGEAPQASYPIKDTSTIPSSAIKLNVTSNSFTPKTFTVNKGQVVDLVVSNVNTSTFSEVFRFDDPSLSGVVLGLAKGETKSITFNAPIKAGNYTFYSDMFNHRELGAEGTMIVK